ncbi:MAG TPA: GNAT family N-acetyltransferase [Ktedonobacterales bacterium]
MSDIVLDVSPESLARANDANMIEGFAACVRAYGGDVADEPDLLWCAGPMGVGSRVLRSQLAPETVDDRIWWVMERARASRTPFYWYISPSTRPADLDTRLLRHGFTDGGDEPAMGVALARLPSVLPLPEGVTVEQVSDRAALEEWARTAYEVLGAPNSEDAPFVAAVSRDTLDNNAAAHYYLARLDGTPVATAGLTLAAGVAGLFLVATVEAARGRGIGAAITMAPLLAARDRGYAVGVLQASEMGYPIYSRMGFTEQFRYRSFYWKPD